MKRRSIPVRNFVHTSHGDYCRELLFLHVAQEFQRSNSSAPIRGALGASPCRPIYFQKYPVFGRQDDNLMPGRFAARSWPGPHMKENVSSARSGGCWGGGTTTTNPTSPPSRRPTTHRGSCIRRSRQPLTLIDNSKKQKDNVQ